MRRLQAPSSKRHAVVHDMERGSPPYPVRVLRGQSAGPRACSFGPCTASRRRSSTRTLLHQALPPPPCILPPTRKLARGTGSLTFLFRKQTRMLAANACRWRRKPRRSPPWWQRRRNGSSRTRVRHQRKLCSLLARVRHQRKLCSLPAKVRHQRKLCPPLARVLQPVLNEFASVRTCRTAP